MWTLVFDTTTNYCSVLLLKDTQKVDLFSSFVEFGQAELLMVKIEEFLSRAKLSLKDVDLIGVCNGPGSFTGVRSSVAAANTFALASHKLKVIGVNAFDVYLQSLKNTTKADRNVILIETKRDDFYVAYYDKEFKPIESGKTAFVADIISDLKGFSLALAGNGVQRFLTQKPSLLVENAIKEECPPIEHLALETIKRFSHKKFDVVKPIYLKAADICVK